jgi:hypothetical protein
MVKMNYNQAFYTINDIRSAEVLTRGILGHEDILSRLDWMVTFNCTELPWFKFTDTERDIISDYCGIKPHFKENDYYDSENYKALQYVRGERDSGDE